MTDASNSVLEAQAFRKIGWRLLPILTIGYIFNYLDRSNIAFAGLTMNREFGLTASQFGFGAGILSLGYCGFEVPANVLLYKVGARRWLARIMITWGIVSAGQILARGPTSFYIARFLLGVAEAGFFPGVTFYLAGWFPSEFRARILAWFLVAIPMSSVIGGPLSGSLLGLNGVLGLSGWKWMFLVEAIPSIVIGVALLFMLCDRPADAKWLTDEEKAAVVARIEAEQRDRPVTAFWPALTDVRVLLCAGLMLGFTIGSYGVGIWLPLILKEARLSNLAVGWLSAIPYLVASVGMIAWAAMVDRSGRKIANLVLACLLSAGGFVLALATGSFAMSLVGFSIALVGVTSARAIFWTVPTRFLTGIAAAGGLAFINTIGTMGGFFGPSIMGWLKDATGSYTAGLLAMAGFLVMSALFAASLKFVVRQE